jgi:hypothetical protein
MSGVAGAQRVQSRSDFQQFVNSYTQLLSKFPGFVSMQPSGSYNSNPNKQDFGDIDLITHIQSDQPKADVKRQLAAYLSQLPDTVIVPFSSPKHQGKKFYNSGEIISVRYHDAKLNYSVQIDNIIALSPEEAEFKQSFLNFPAEVQGLILGLTKIATVETPADQLMRYLGIAYVPLKANEEYEFTASPIEVQLRRVTYEPGTYNQLSREIIWRSNNIKDLEKILYQYNIHTSFADLLAQAKNTIKDPRSRKRLVGVFSSMVSVKSGEVGTPKGEVKQQAINTVSQAFMESNNWQQYHEIFKEFIKEQR